MTRLRRRVKPTGLAGYCPKCEEITRVGLQADAWEQLPDYCGRCGRDRASAPGCNHLHSCLGRQLEALPVSYRCLTCGREFKVVDELAARLQNSPKGD